jgi:uncharacterized protein (TIGR03118 family)
LTEELPDSGQHDPRVFLIIEVSVMSANSNRVSASAWATRVFAPFAALTLVACGGGSGGGDGYGGSGYGGNPGAGNAAAPVPPTVTISVQPTAITAGQSATLTWSTIKAGTCTASGAWSGTQAGTGTQVVTPSAAGSAVFTLTCSDTTASVNANSSATLTVNAASSYSVTKLVSDSAGTGTVSTDTHLVNPWGIAFPLSGVAWVANNHTGTATLYDGNGKPQPNANPRIVQMPAGPGGAAFDPTGIVANSSSTDFVVSSGSSSGVAKFIFSGEGGMIAGWNPGVDANALLSYTDASGAVYKGLAVANNGTANFLYATDFHNNKVDVFDATFTKQSTFAFVDPTLPAGYAPFGIQAIPGRTGGVPPQLYVTYAQQQGPDNRINTIGAGLGLVDVFDANGVFVKRLIPVGGALNAPWGLALAPSDFGTLADALLVGNFGDGKINAYDPSSGQLIGTLQDSSGAAFAAPGLWGIAFGNGAANQARNALFFAAGVNNEADGIYGRIDLGAVPTLNAPPVVTLTAPPAGSVTGTVALTATVTDSVGIANVKFFLNATTLLGTVTASPFTFNWDTSAVPNGAAALTATATDVDGNVGTSSAVNVTVGPPAATLTQVQADVFTPLCSGCHNGSQPANGPLPGSQNLTAGQTFLNIVGVASREQSTLMRVNPGDPDNSYLVRKVEGAAGITGVQMPFGGPPLSQAQIDEIRSWIASGAPNN